MQYLVHFLQNKIAKQALKITAVRELLVQVNLKNEKHSLGKLIITISYTTKL